MTDRPPAHADDRVDRVQDVVRDVVTDHDAIAMGEGKQVLELTPPLDWDKGTAVEWITDTVCRIPRRSSTSTSATT